MRVLFHHAATEWSGCARAFADGARLLAERGWQVGFTCRPDSAVEHRLTGLPGIEVSPLAAEGTWLDESNQLRRVLRDEFVEAVFVHTSREHLVAAAALRMAERGAVVRRIPVGASLELDLSERTAASLTPGGFVFSTPEDLKAAALPRRPFPAGVAPLGVDVEAARAVRPSPPSALGVPDGEQLLVCVMDRDARSSVATVLRALGLLIDRHPGLRLAVVGPGADHEDLRMHAAALGITQAVGFLGEREDRLSVLRTADIGWVVARHDDGAYAFLDFMSLEVPVIAERGPIAAHYVADGITGTILPPADPPAAAAAVATLVAQPEVRSAMGRAAQGRAARDFPEQAMAEGFAQVAGAARDRSKWRA